MLGKVQIYQSLNSLLEMNMSKVDIYTKGHCPYCHRAKALLTEKKVNFNEIEIDVMPELRSTMIERAKGNRLFRKFHQRSSCRRL